MSNKTKVQVGIIGLIAAAMVIVLPRLPVDHQYLNALAKRAQWTSVLPPFCAIGMAFLTRRILLSLAVAIVLGGVLSAGINPLVWVPKVRDDYFLATVTDEFKIWILVFTTSLIGMVKVISRMGGTLGLVDWLKKIARGPRSTNFATALLGTAIFFDDYANSIVVGTTMRPLTDRLRISREKLAYLVDSTAAPVAGLAIISTWIGFEVERFAAVAEAVNLDQDGYAIFFQAVPYRFYCLFTLLFVFVNALSGRDFGPMRRAESRARTLGQLTAPQAKPAGGKGLTDVEPVQVRRPRPVNAILPVGIVLLVTVVGMLYDGGAFDRGDSLLELRSWQVAFGSADNSTLVLAVASLVGSAVAIGLAVGQRIMSFPAAFKAWVTGTAAMGWIAALLILAWAIGAVTEDLGTAHYLVALVKGRVAPGVLPVIVFCLAGLIAFATGTSWGTMAILIPTVGPVAFQLGGAGLLIICLAAVLDGAIFGDHCSPISDTTVISSMASFCDHLDHVNTQLPYAICCAGIALVFGYVIVGAGGSAWVAYLSAATMILVVMFLIGKPPAGVAPSNQAAPGQPKHDKIS